MSATTVSNRMFDRRATVLLSSPVPNDYLSISEQTEIDQLRIQFEITKSLVREPNTANITITNLAEGSRGRIEKASKVTLTAGYEDSQSVIFIGDVRTAEHFHNRPDWETVIGAGDGERAYKHARMSESFKAGTPAGLVVKACARAMGFDDGVLKDVVANVNASHAYKSGYTAHGRASDELTKVLTATDYEWSIQDQQLQVLAWYEVLPASVTLSSETGLLGSPSAGTPESVGDRPTMLIRSLLQPEIKPGALIDLQSRQHNGRFKVYKVRHVGDTAGGDWYSEAECKMFGETPRKLRRVRR